ncbi:hypothetical protein [Breoghania sp.]|uniref:hypothetical protein n=1 Tax=Breoghania sp. TaxID=2065378 RepID=UPI0026096DC8|nr:hypothetical protein [Breoghania sp.]MDJ0932518.1 hypothetical protein [Breoghania sp.]
MWTGEGETSSGSHTLAWDGTTTDGTTTVVGVVTGIDSSSGDTVLQIGDAEIEVDNILSIQP